MSYLNFIIREEINHVFLAEDVNATAQQDPSKVQDMTTGADGLDDLLAGDDASAGGDGTDDPLAGGEGDGTEGEDGSSSSGDPDLDSLLGSMGGGGGMSLGGGGGMGGGGGLGDMMGGDDAGSASTDDGSGGEPTDDATQGDSADPVDSVVDRVRDVSDSTADIPTLLKTAKADIQLNHDDINIANGVVGKLKTDPNASLRSTGVRLQQFLDTRP